MDPDEAYQRVCDNVNAILNGAEGDLIELAEAFESLDLWLKSGGLLPDPWRSATKRKRRRYTDDDWREIAEVYKKALRQKTSVLEAVATLRGVSKSQAGRIIQLTRQRGYIPAANGRGIQTVEIIDDPYFGA